MAPESILDPLEAMTILKTPEFVRQLLYVETVYNGSNGEETTQLYNKLRALGPAGVISLNLLRAHKTSERAKEVSLDETGNSIRGYRTMDNQCHVGWKMFSGFCG